MTGSSNRGCSVDDESVAGEEVVEEAGEESETETVLGAESEVEEEASFLPELRVKDDEYWEEPM